MGKKFNNSNIQLTLVQRRLAISYSSNFKRSGHLFKNFYLNKTDDHFVSENLHFLNIRITRSVAFIFRQERNRRKGDLKQNLVVQNLELLFKIRHQFSPYTKMYVGRKNRSYPN